jgi:hypothetical protein
MFNTDGYSLADISAATGNNKSNGFGGDGSWWIIILFLFVMSGWGGNGFGGANNGSTKEALAYSFDFNGLENGVRGIANGLCDGFYQINTGLLNGFASTQNQMAQGFNGLNTQYLIGSNAIQQAMNSDTNAILAKLSGMSAENAACCCATQREIERGFADLGYNLATQECQTRQAIADAAKGITDFLVQDKISTLTAENQALKFAASQTAQNAYLVHELGNKAPVPAYIVANPYAANSCC